jgi:Spy/CpxP family protein refolding chaperone
MKFKSVPLLAVTIAGTAMILAACKAPNQPEQQATGSSAQAQNTEMPDTSNPPGRGSNNSMRGDGLPPSLNLTDDQKTKIKAIQENYRSKMQSILTDQQKNQLKAAREQGKGRSGMQSLNLTDAQKQQMKDLRQSQRQEMYKVLTAEQKQQLQKMGQNRQRKSKSEDSPTAQGQ